MALSKVFAVILLLSWFEKATSSDNSNDGNN